MNPCELTYTITALANALAQQMDEDELAIASFLLSWEIPSARYPYYARSVKKNPAHTTQNAV